MSLLALEMLVRQKKLDIRLLTKFAFLGSTLNVARSIHRMDQHFIVGLVHFIEPPLSNLASVRITHIVRLRPIVKVPVASL
jgi:hypothetical protein